MTTHIIYHMVNETTDCPDGVISAAIAASACSFDCQVQGDTYQKTYSSKPDPQKYPFKKGDLVVIVDFSYPLQWLQYWEKQGIDLVVIDHHESKFMMLKGFSGAVLDKNECGATLTWKHFYPKRKIPALLKYVRQRDIGVDGYYEGKIRESEAINEALSNWKSATKKEAGSFILYLKKLFGQLDKEDFVQDLLKTGMLDLEERDRIVEEAVSSPCVQLKELEGYTVPYLLLSEKQARHVSVIGNAIAKKYFSCQFAWLETPGGQHHLRSCNGFDVRPIAQTHGGDGHPPAAGFRK